MKGSNNGSKVVAGDSTMILSTCSRDSLVVEGISVINRASDVARIWKSELAFLSEISIMATVRNFSWKSSRFARTARDRGVLTDRWIRAPRVVDMASRLRSTC